MLLFWNSSYFGKNKMLTCTVILCTFFVSVVLTFKTTNFPCKASHAKYYYRFGFMTTFEKSIHVQTTKSSSTKTSVYIPRPITYNTDLSSKLESLKSICLLINDQWSFDITDPETGIHYYALGNGVGIADWRSLWTKSGWVDTNGIYTLCISKSKVDANTVNYIIKTIRNLNIYSGPMMEAAQKIAQLTHNLKKSSEEHRKERQKIKATNKQVAKNQQHPPAPDTIVNLIRKYLISVSLQTRKIPRALKNTVRRCGGGYIRFDLVITHIMPTAIFVLLREPTESELTLIEQRSKRNPQRKTIILPITEWQASDLVKTSENLISQLESLLQIQKVS